MSNILGVGTFGDFNEIANMVKVLKLQAEISVSFASIVERLPPKKYVYHAARPHLEYAVQIYYYLEFMQRLATGPAKDFRR